MNFECTVMDHIYRLVTRLLGVKCSESADLEMFIPYSVYVEISSIQLIGTTTRSFFNKVSNVNCHYIKP